MFFAIAALRAIVEMLALCLLAQGLLYVISGRQRQGNPIYRLFALITHFPRRLIAMLLPLATPPWVVGLSCFTVLFMLWISLALARSFL
jgi:hypothetical protein